MANVTDKVAIIRNATYGNEVREGIASGIENINTEVISTTGRQTTLEGTQGILQSQFSDVVTNATATDPSSVEIVAARLGEVDLPTKIGQIDTSLADIAKLHLIDITKPPTDSNLTLPFTDGIQDNRAIIQNIINYASTNGYEGIYIPYNVNPYMLNVNHTNINLHNDNGLKIPSNFKLIMHPDTVLKAIDSTFTHQVMINVYDSINVLISGGTIVGERLSHGVEVSEFGYGIYVWGSENVVIENVTANDFWGDGFVTRDIDTKSSNNFLQPCKNITFKHIIADNNCRQGLSIISGKGVRVIDSVFKNTNGTAPQSGIDIEPNWVDIAKRVENVVIDKCEFINNVGNCIQVIWAINVIIQNCRCDTADIYLHKDTESVTVFNNKLLNCGVTIYSKNASVIDNVIEGATTGISLFGENEGMVNVTGNKILNCSRGIKIANNNTPKNALIKNNYIYGSTSAVITMNGGMTARNINFIDNIFEANIGDGIVNLIDSEINGNTFIDSNTYSLFFGVGSDSVDISNNIFKLKNRTFVLSFIKISVSANNIIIDNNHFYTKSSDNLTYNLINVETPSSRTTPILIRNSIAKQPTTFFTTPQANVIFEGNYAFAS